MEQSVLVIGGGVAGIEAALQIDAQGFPVFLVEKEAELGGRLRILDRLSPDGALAKDVLDNFLDRVKGSSVTVMTETAIKSVGGFVGNFEVVTTRGTLKVGAIILAIGSALHDPTGSYGYGEIPGVITNLELEKMLLESDSELNIAGKKPAQVAFIQCVGSRDPEVNPNCSRICCITSVKQARRLREAGIDTAIFYRDLRASSHGGEEAYHAARGEGVVFVRYPDDKKPRVTKVGDKCHVEAFDSMLGTSVEMEADLVVLAAGMVAREADTAEFKEILKIPRSPDGFMMERHPKLGPVETNTEGIFLAGCIQSPKSIGDSVAQAAAAASKAVTLICRDTVELAATTCEVIEEACRGCGTCASICDFHAPELHEVAPGVTVARINEALCKGCGTCAAWCPTNAIRAKHFTDQQIESMLKAMLLEEVA